MELAPVYDSEKYDLIRDLQVPLLAKSREYLRGVGFFTSGWLRIAATGLIKFVENRGRARFVVSPILDEADWAAMQAGDAARLDNALQNVLSRCVESLAVSLEKDTRNALAWMVAHEIVEFRFAVPRSRDATGLYHDKVGVFRDESGDVVAIHGSLNDSANASFNGEAFSVFKSWEPGQALYVESHCVRLESLWNDRNRSFAVFRIPDAIRADLMRLRTTPRPPYNIPSSVRSQVVAAELPPGLRDYQLKAIECWRQAGYRGIFDMATGTGKTITSLGAAVVAHRELGRLVLVIEVPYLHLLGQWQTACRNVRLDPILCSGEHQVWRANLKSAIRDMNLGIRNCLTVLAVHNTAASDEFVSVIGGVHGNSMMVIADEVHRLGSRQMRRAMLENVPLRLGLSATPRRWFDDEGTEVIMTYFGDVCFCYDLDKAIGDFLTPYEYHPELVSLTDNELDYYDELSRKIAVLSSKGEDDGLAERVKHLLVQRSHIVAAASNKIPAAMAIIESLVRGQRRNGEVHGILLYCAPGQHKEVLRAVAQSGLRCHEFVHSVKLPERERVLSEFARGEIQALVAVRCLDEGVDVPSTQRALILASSSNPREFIQRRGRILRKAPGKSRAVIHDFVVVPSPKRVGPVREAEVSILRREMPRFVEFADSATNAFAARQSVAQMLNHLGMLHLLDDKPWDVYHKLKQLDWSE